MDLEPLNIGNICTDQHKNPCKSGGKLFKWTPKQITDLEGAQRDRGGSPKIRVVNEAVGCNLLDLTEKRKPQLASLPVSGERSAVNLGGSRAVLIRHVCPDTVGLGGEGGQRGRGGVDH
ncbi:hypothetical protein RRG08_016822 [Elysia crispata]|uniref:Uncharacterized protein n=1 Tax=Elysia crispata TaxID=231223 RepID=A0AAE0ZZ46_9GAST|nr:hypothetical protein RRG08_016822 [Elysia crispata]